MTLDDAAALIGTDMLWLAPGSAEKMMIGVTIIGARMSYGRAQVQIRPLSGRGTRWVLADLVQEIED